MSHFNIIILDPVNVIRQKVSQILEKDHIKVFEAEQSMEFFNILKKDEHTIDMIITEIELRGEDGFEIIKKIKDIENHIPIMILTANSKKDLIIKAIQKGANGIIIKPFEGAILREKIMKILNKKEMKINDRVNLNLPTLIQKELVKAKKGKYEVSVLMANFFKPVDNFTNELEQEYHRLSPSIYDSLKPLFWETDYFVQYGSQTFIGIFPFCNKENTLVIEKKMEEKFKELKNINKAMDNFFLEKVFITYPTDENNSSDTLIKATELLKKSIDSKKKSIRKENEEDSK